MLCVIRTDMMNVAMVGRVGSRSITTKIIGEHVEDEIDFLHNYTPKVSFDQFNNYETLFAQMKNAAKPIPNVLVLRDPYERAESGSSCQLSSIQHGRPYLHNINIEQISHVIHFKDLSNYVDSRVGTESDYLLRNSTLEQKLSAFPEYHFMFEDWSKDDYTKEQWDEEYRFYEQLKLKEVLTPEMFRSKLADSRQINIKKIAGMRYRAWDM
jgi:hypothetical protein